jgi:signal transduction histidine kinase
VPDAQTEIGMNIRVTDSGIGVSKDDRENLFKMYFKTKDEKSRTINGGSHGIGLSVCKNIA